MKLRKINIKSFEVNRETPDGGYTWVGGKDHLLMNRNMENQRKSSGLGLITIAVFVVVALAGIGLTVWLAAGSTAGGVIGGLLTFAGAWLAAWYVNKKF